MTDRLPALTGAQMAAILRRHGFDCVRQSGSHQIFRHVDGRRTTVPVHAGRDLGRGLLRKIMRDAGLEAGDLDA
jgi:predicted RNA binding protein YcfA (HicA-like mRNA interferase family)